MGQREYDVFMQAALDAVDAIKDYSGCESPEEAALKAAIDGKYENYASAVSAVVSAGAKMAGINRSC